MSEDRDQDQNPYSFRAVSDEKPPSLVVEFWEFLRHSKKWWLAPIILVLLGIGVVAALSGSAAAPFIYALW